MSSRHGGKEKQKVQVHCEALHFMSEPNSNVVLLLLITSQPGSSIVTASLLPRQPASQPFSYLAS